MNCSKWLQQNGAPPHYFRSMRDYLDKTFRISRSSNLERPARSTDLILLDFFSEAY